MKKNIGTTEGNKYKLFVKARLYSGGLSSNKTVNATPFQQRYDDINGVVNVRQVPVPGTYLPIFPRIFAR